MRLDGPSASEAGCYPRRDADVAVDIAPQAAAGRGLDSVFLGLTRPGGVRRRAPRPRSGARLSELLAALAFLAIAPISCGPTQAPAPPVGPAQTADQSKGGATTGKPAGPTSAGGSKGPGAPRPPAPPIDVQLGPVTVGEAARSVDVTGTLYGDIEATIASKVTGRLALLQADLGDAVETGAPLADLDRRDYELELAQRERTVAATLAELGLERAPDAGFDVSAVPSVRQRRSEADNAKAKYERAKRLFEQTPPLIAEQDLADLRTAWQMAMAATESAQLAAKALIAKAEAEDAAVAIARQRLDDTRLSVPTDDAGRPRTFRVAERLASVGELMNVGTPIVRLVSIDPIRYRATVPERFAAEVAVGQRATLALEGRSAPSVGTVSRISPRIDERSRSFEVEVTVPNADGSLKPGAFAKGSIEYRRDAGITFVPSAAVVTFAGVDRVFTVKDGKAVAHRVRVGRRQGDLIEVTGEIGADQVVVGNAAGLSQDAPVTVKAASGG